MNRADRAKLARLQRLEQVRAIAKQAAAAESARAEGTLAQLEALAARTGRMFDDYAARRDVPDGQALQQLTRFREGLAGVSRSTLADTERARQLADLKLAQLAEAERRRQAVEDRARGEAQSLAAKAQQPVLSGRRPTGTPLE